MKMLTKSELFNLYIAYPSIKVYQDIKSRWDNIAKPLDSMGHFENIIARIGAIHENIRPHFEVTSLIIMCADNGVVAEGISQSNQDVTSIVAAEMGRKNSSVCLMAKKAGIKVIPIDIGINGETPAGVADYKVRPGTANFRKEPAMTEEEMLRAITIGMELVKERKEAGDELIFTGEMGIGNTTTSSACVAAILMIDAERVTGKGAGLGSKAMHRKVNIINESIAKYKLSDIEDDKVRAFETLRCVGGLDIAGLVGVCIGGAMYKMPIVLDGLITMAAALVADTILPGVKEYVIASHQGKEPAVSLIKSTLNLRPVIHANMGLGEGTGAIMLLPLLQMVNALYESGEAFEEMGVTRYERYDE